MGEYIKVKGARALPRGVIDIGDIAYYVRGISEPTPEKVSLYPIPFGPMYGMITVKKAVPWKFKKGVEFEKIAADHGKLLNANKFIREVSKAYAGVKGVVWVGGYPYPKKAIEQKKWKSKPELERKYKEFLGT